MQGKPLRPLFVCIHISSTAYDSVRMWFALYSGKMSAQDKVGGIDLHTPLGLLPPERDLAI